jgi:hypothetical protein
MSSDKEDMTRSIKLPPTINIALRNIKDAKVIRGRVSDPDPLKSILIWLS